MSVLQNRGPIHTSGIMVQNNVVRSVGLLVVAVVAHFAILQWVQLGPDELDVAEQIVLGWRWEEQYIISITWDIPNPRFNRLVIIDRWGTGRALSLCIGIALPCMLLVAFTRTKLTGALVALAVSIGVATGGSIALGVVVFATGLSGLFFQNNHGQVECPSHTG